MPIYLRKLIRKARGKRNKQFFNNRFLRRRDLLFTITAKHIELTDAIKEHAESKTSKLPKYYSSINHVEVIVEGNEGGKISVEIIARAEHSNIFIATETGEDVYKCIDLAVHKLERQLRRKKTRQRDDKRANNTGLE